MVYKIQANEGRSGFHCFFFSRRKAILRGHNRFSFRSAGMYDFQCWKKRSDKLERCLSKQRR